MIQLYFALARLWKFLMELLELAELAISFIGFVASQLWGIALESVSRFYSWAKKSMSVVVVVVLSVSAMAQPANDRKQTIWKARYENTVWRLVDDGGQRPLLSGHLLHRDRIYTLVPARFDYGSNILRTVAVGGGETQRVEIQYIREEGSNIVAEIGGQTVYFTKE